MRLGKKESAGYVADIETDEVPDLAVAPAVASKLAPVAEPVAREPEKAATAG
ncbi:MAG: hypothetical protein ACRDN0_36530 [Trebonia sp.]